MNFVPIADLIRLILNSEKLHGLNCEKQSLNSLLTSFIFIGYSLGSLVGGVPVENILIKKK